MTLKWQLIGADRLARDIDVTVAQIPAAIGVPLAKAAAVVVAEIQKQIRGSRTRAKRSGHKAGLYRRVSRTRASGKFARRGAEGSRARFERYADIPRNVLGIDSGFLRSSIGSRVSRAGIYRRGRTPLGIGRWLYFIEVGTKVKYARIHERGGVINHTNLFGRGIRARIKMPKRPFFAPGIRKGVPKANRILGGRLVRVVEVR